MGIRGSWLRRNRWNTTFVTAEAKCVRYLLPENFFFNYLGELASAGIISLLNFLKHSELFEHLEEIAKESP